MRFFLRLLTPTCAVVFGLTALACSGIEPRPASDEGLAAIDIAAADSLTCALMGTGAPVCWTGGTTPEAVPGEMTFTSLGTGQAGDHACALASDVAWCWRDNTWGQLGDGTQARREAPVQVAGGHRFTQLALAERTTCGLTTTGSVYCWGDNEAGALGRGHPFAADRSPAPISSADSFYALAAGDYHFCGLRSSDSTAVCWGANDKVQAGSPTTGCLGFACVPLPTQVQAPRAYAQLFAGPDYTCGVTAAGAAWCWGNSYGWSQAASTNTAPERVLGAGTVASLALGQRFMCALSTASTLHCRATDNQFGEAGQGSTAPADFGVVSGNPSVSSVTAALGKACAIRTDGIVICWGRHVGDGGTTVRAAPAIVPKP